MTKPAPTLLLGLAVTAGYFASAKAGLFLAFENDAVTAVWPPTGLALAALVLWGRRLWPAVALGALLANLATGVPLESALGIATGNTLEAVVGATLLARVGFRPSLERVRDVAAFTLLAAGLATTISATVGVGSLWLSGAVGAEGLAPAWRVWWLGDLTGALVVGAPLLVIGSDPGVLRRALAAPGAVATLGLVAAVAAVGFATPEQLAYLAFPPVVWMAFRYRQLGAVGASFVLAGIGIYFTARGHGPFVSGSEDASLVRSQTFAAVAAVTALVMAAVRTEFLNADSERRAAELSAESLRRSETLLADAQRIGGFGSWELDPVTGDTKWSHRLHEITGIPPEEVEKGRAALMDFVDPGDRPALERALQQIQEDRAAFAFEIGLVPGCASRSLQLRGEAVGSGADLRICGTAQDLTARRRSEETFRQLLEAAPDAMVIVDERGEIVLVNAQAEELFGYGRAEMLGRPVEMLLPADRRRGHAAERQGFFAAPSTRPMGRGSELSAARKDGSEIPVEVSLSPLETEQGTLVLSAIRDISDRRAAEQRIRESVAQMAEAQEIARFGSWEWSPASGEVRWSEVLYDMYGVSPRDFSPSFEGYLARVHADDRDEVARAVSAALAATEPFAFVERIVRPDGEVRLLRSQGRPLLDDDGNVVRMIGVCHDITELRKAEQARRDAEARFRGAFENAPIGVALVELGPEGAGTFLDVNRSLCLITGYSEQELLERTPDDLTDPRDLESDVAMRRRLALGEIEGYTLEKRCIRSDGDTIWTQLHVSLVREGDDGAPAGYAIVQVQDISERKRFEGQLQHLADHDPLTGLVNRRRFLELLDAEVARHARYGGIGAVLVIDLDHFKYVNDTLGHAVGDELIRRVCALLRERLRGTDTVARLGGDEFAVLLPEVEREQLLELANALVEEIRSRAVVTTADRRIRLSASIGVAEFGGGDTPELTGEMVLVNADIAMYDAKQGGRNRVALLETLDEPKTRMRAQMTWVERVRAALDRDGFELHAQPIVGLRGGEPPRYELLLRMVGDDGEVIPPGAFLPIAEEFGLIKTIDAWVVRHAVALAAERHRAGEPVVLEVNLSGASLTDLDLLAVVEAEIASNDVDPRSLVFEVTETAAIVNIDTANRFAQRLRTLGCGFALDDFGAGFGSFYYLKHLPFDYLKIDGDFVRNLPTSETDQLTVKAIVEIAHGLGKKAIAEFVENGETLELLRGYGVDYVQGYHLGRPEPTRSWWNAVRTPAGPRRR